MGRAFFKPLTKTPNMVKWEKYKKVRCQEERNDVESE